MLNKEEIQYWKEWVKENKEETAGAMVLYEVADIVNDFVKKIESLERKIKKLK